MYNNVININERFIWIATGEIVQIRNIILRKKDRLIVFTLHTDKSDLIKMTLTECDFRDGIKKP